MKIGTIILAAGNSSRLGKPKQLIEFNGATLLQRITSIALNATLSPVIVVEGKNNYPLSPHPNLKKVMNPEWEKGMGSSLKLGVETLEKTYQPEQVLILLSDQPMVSKELIQSLLIRKAESNLPIVASYYQNSPGVPAIFGKSVFKRLKLMPDKGGAKMLLISHPELVSLVKFEEGKIDIDTPSDLVAFKNSNWEHFND